MRARRLRASSKLALAAISVAAASCSLINGNFVGGPAAIDGPFTVAGPLMVGGPATVHGPVRARKLIVGGPIWTIPGRETPGPAGQAVSGPVSIGGPLTVNGPLTVDGTLTVGGPLTAETTGPYLDQPAGDTQSPPPGQYSRTPVTE